MIWISEFSQQTVNWIKGSSEYGQQKRCFSVEQKQVSPAYLNQALFVGTEDRLPILLFHPSNPEGAIKSHMNLILTVTVPPLTTQRVWAKELRCECLYWICLVCIRYIHFQRHLCRQFWHVRVQVTYLIGFHRDPGWLALGYDDMFLFWFNPSQKPSPTLLLTPPPMGSETQLEG